MHVRREPRLLVTGDFNDTPEGDVVQGVMQAGAPDNTPSPHRLYNLMAGKRPGTYRYRGEWSTIDHLLVSGLLLDENAGFHTRSDAATIVTFPYLRMMCGPVDYTPGAMRNATKQDWRPMYYTPQSMGTRAHQAACYVVFDSPFTMLCDAPTEYEREPEYTKFIASIPTVFDETRILAGRMGESIVTARRKGSDWYVGALTNWDGRTLQVPLSFLPEGKTYEAEYLEDGINAGKRANDYTITRTGHVSSSSTATLKMASGGGAVLKLRAVE